MRVRIYIFELEPRESNGRVSDAYRGEDEKGREIAYKKILGYRDHL